MGLVGVDLERAIAEVRPLRRIASSGRMPEYARSETRIASRGSMRARICSTTSGGSGSARSRFSCLGLSTIRTGLDGMRPRTTARLQMPWRMPSALICVGAPTPALSSWARKSSISAGVSSRSSYSPTPVEQVLGPYLPVHVARPLSEVRHGVLRPPLVHHELAEGHLPLQDRACHRTEPLTALNVVLERVGVTLALEKTRVLLATFAPPNFVLVPPPGIALDAHGDPP